MWVLRQTMERTTMRLCLAMLVIALLIPQTIAGAEGCMEFRISTDREWDDYVSGTYYRLSSHVSCNSRPVYRHHNIRDNYIYIYLAHLASGEERWVLSESICNESSEQFIMTTEGHNMHLLEDINTGPWFTSNGTQNETVVYMVKDCQEHFCNEVTLDYDTYDRRIPYRYCNGRPLHINYETGDYLYYRILPDGWRGWVVSPDFCGVIAADDSLCASSYAYAAEDVRSEWEEYSILDDTWSYKNGLKVECDDYGPEYDCEECDSLKTATICLSIFFAASVIALLVVLLTCVKKPKRVPQDTQNSYQFTQSSSPSNEAQISPVTVAGSGDGDHATIFVAGAASAAQGGVEPTRPPAYESVFGQVQ